MYSGQKQARHKIKKVTCMRRILPPLPKRNKDYPTAFNGPPHNASSYHISLS